MRLGKGVPVLLLLAALSAVSAHGNVNKCKRGWKAYPIKHGHIVKSFEAGGADNFAADLLRRVVEDKGEKRGCKIVAIKPVQKACGKLVKRTEDRGRVWDNMLFEFRTIVKYSCGRHRITRRYEVSTTVESDVRTWGSTLWEARSYKERRV